MTDTFEFRSDEEVRLREENRRLRKMLEETLATLEYWQPAADRAVGIMRRKGRKAAGRPTQAAGAPQEPRSEAPRPQTPGNRSGDLE